MVIPWYDSDWMATNGHNGRIRLADLRKTGNVTETLRSMLERPNAGEGRLVRIRANISKLEEKYEMSTDEMIGFLKKGIIQDTPDISDWLFYLNELEAARKTELARPSR